jgi:hypothetical protein
LENHLWAIWKRCRLAGYVNAYSEWEALKKAEEKFGKEIFVIRMDNDLEATKINTHQL